VKIRVIRGLFKHQAALDCGALANTKCAKKQGMNCISVQSGNGYKGQIVAFASSSFLKRMRDNFS
jgi:hypothetical protein